MDLEMNAPRRKDLATGALKVALIALAAPLLATLTIGAWLGGQRVVPGVDVLSQSVCGFLVGGTRTLEMLPSYVDEGIYNIRACEVASSTNRALAHAIATDGKLCEERGLWATVLPGIQLKSCTGRRSPEVTIEFDGDSCVLVSCR